MPYRNTLWPSRKEVRALLIHSLGAALSAPLTFKMCSTPLSCRQPVPVLTELPLQIKGLRQFGIQELLHLLCVRVLSSKQSGANSINSVLGFFSYVAVSLRGSKSEDGCEVAVYLPSLLCQFELSQNRT